MLATTAILLAACGGTTTAPTTCPTDAIVLAMNDYVEGSVFIDTEWEPAPDTDLEAALSAGGVACSYGLQEAEIGATILWAPADGVFADRREQWKADGQTEVTVEGTTEAWALQETGGAERHLWALNLLVDGTWIHIGATFLSDLDEARGLIDAAISATK